MLTYLDRVFLKYAKLNSKVIALYVRLGVGEVEALLDLHGCFEHCLLKPFRVYVAIDVTYVRDYTSFEQYNLEHSFRLRTQRFT